MTPTEPGGRPGGGREHGGAVLARNTLLNLGGLGLPLVVALFTMPIVVDGLGPARFGILALVWVVLGYVALLDLGLGRGTTKFAAEARAAGAPERIGGIVRAAAAGQVVLGALAGGILALGVPLLVERALNVAPSLVPEARLSFYLLAAATPALLVANSFRGLLEARQRFDLVNAVRLPASTANFLVPLAGVLLGWDVASIVGALMAVRVLATAAYAWLAVRGQPGLLRRGRVPREQVRALLGFGGWLTVSSLISPLLVYLDRFMIGGVLTMAAVGYYAAPHEAVMRLTLLPAAVVATLFPAFSAGAGTGDLARVRDLVAGAFRFLLIAAGPLLVGLAVLAPDLLGLWLGPEFAEQSGLALRLFAVGMLANTLAYVPAVLLQGVGRPDIPARIHMIELPVYVVLLWIAVRAWGIPGGAGAWAARMIVDAGLLLGAARRLGLIDGRELRARRIPGAVAALGGLLVAGVAAGALAPTPLGRVAAVGVVLVLGVLAMTRTLLDPAERRHLLEAIGYRAAAS